MGAHEADEFLFLKIDACKAAKVVLLLLSIVYEFINAVSYLFRIHHENLLLFRAYQNNFLYTIQIPQMR
jgi:hypothetical protein